MESCVGCEKLFNREFECENKHAVLCLSCLYDWIRYNNKLETTCPICRASYTSLPTMNECWGGILNVLMPELKECWLPIAPPIAYVRAIRNINDSSRHIRSIINVAPFSPNFIETVLDHVENGYDVNMPISNADMRNGVYFNWFQDTINEMTHASLQRMHRASFISNMTPPQATSAPCEIVTLDQVEALITQKEQTSRRLTNKDVGIWN
jgi:hypothetical protein